MSASITSFLHDLRDRGLLQQATHESALEQHLASADLSKGGCRAYVGFDPTADSLTIGNLVGIMALARWQRAGHTPVVVAGGGTGFIGDPSGKSAERTLQTPEQITHNVEAIKKIFSRVIDLGGSAAPTKPNAGLLLDNYDWLGKLSLLEALRDVGKHFSVNMMMAKESVKERLHNRDQGISFTEFSYMILQAYDFAHLFEEYGVTVQMGGSDQFGNIVCGIDLIGKRARQKVGHIAANRIGRLTYSSEVHKHNLFAEHVYGFTWPLVTKADGTKFGKTESGAIWLTAKQGEDDTSPSRTSPYQFYQFWLNAADADVSRFLRTFTLLPMEEIRELEARQAADPAKREAQRALAQHMTDLLHGREERDKAEHAAKALFSKPGGAGGNADVPFVLPEDLLTSAPSSSHDKALLAGTGLALVDLLPQTTLAKSKTEARTHLSANAVSVNGHVAALDARVTEASLLPGGLIALRRGKKSWHITRWA